MQPCDSRRGHVLFGEGERRGVAEPGGERLREACVRPAAEIIFVAAANHKVRLGRVEINRHAPVECDKSHSTSAPNQLPSR